MRTRLANVPTRARAGLLSFGVILGLPAVFVVLGAALVAVDLAAVGALAFLLAVLVLLGATVTAWILIFQARGRLQRAERAVYAGDLDTATREARFVIGTVFRADYQLGALYTLAVAAERLGAFREAGELFLRALSRRPTAKELEATSKIVAGSPKRDEGMQDVLWALINSKEFMFCH